MTIFVTFMKDVAVNVGGREAAKGWRLTCLPGLMLSSSGVKMNLGWCEKTCLSDCCWPVKIVLFARSGLVSWRSVPLDTLHALSQTFVRKTCSEFGAKSDELNRVNIFSLWLRKMLLFKWKMKVKNKTILIVISISNFKWFCVHLINIFYFVVVSFKFFKYD